MANGNDKDWLDVSTSLPEDNKGKDRNRELFHNKPFEVGPEGYTEEELAINEQLVKNIQGTQAIAKQVGVDNIMGSPMTGPSMDWMHHKFDIKTAAAQKYGGEGYDYEDEKSYQKYKKQSQGRSLNNIEHYAKMQELGYEASVKKYQDDLYENQSYLDMATNFVSKTIGNTLIHTGGGLVGTIYGATKALVTWDSEALFDNEVFTATDAATDYLNRRLVVHGDAEYYDIMNDPERREEMSLGSRFMSHPFKVLNDDVSSAISFVGGTVLTEVAASLLAAPTGGASLVAATARNGALLTRGFRNSVKVLRGLDKASDFEKARKIIETTQKYQKLLGTTRATMMGAGYEAGLIGRETRDQTLEQMKENYKEQYGSEPQGATLEKMEREAKEAGDMSYWMNMGLVGGSNFIQFGRLFNKFKGEKSAFSGLKKDLKDGWVVTGKGRKKFWAESLTGKDLHWSLAVPYQVLKKPMVEAFEEYAQGVIQDGTAEWYSSVYSPEGIEGRLTFMESFKSNGEKYFKSREGKDSMTMGFLMGLFGFGLPTRARHESGPKKGKRKLIDFHGGLGETVQDWKRQRESIEQMNGIAKKLNDQSAVGINLEANMRSMLRQKHTQEGIDQSLDVDNAFEYKSKEFDSMFNYVNARQKVGLEDTILQELDAVDNLSLEEFQKTIAAPGVEYNEKTKKEEIAKARTKIKGIIENNKAVETVLNAKVRDITTFGQRFTKKGREKRKAYDEAFEQVQAMNSIHAYNGLKEMLSYTSSSIDNLNQREQELESLLGKVSNGTVNTSKLNEAILEMKNLNPESKDFLNSNFNEMVKETMEEWKKNDPASYAKNKEHVKEILNDLKTIKARRKFAGESYEKLLTPEGQVKFKDWHDELLKEYEEESKKQQKTNLQNQYDNATSEEQAQKIRNDEVGQFGNDDMYQAFKKKQEKNIANATKTTKEKKEREPRKQKKQRKKQETQEKEETDESKIKVKERPDVIDITDPKDPTLNALAKNRTALKTILDKLSENNVDISGVKWRKGVSNEDVIRSIIDKATTDPHFSEEFQIAVMQNLEVAEKEEASNKSTENPANSKDNERPDESETTESDVDKSFNTIKGNQKSQTGQSGPTHTIGVFLDKAFSFGKVIYDKVTGIVKQNKNRDKQSDRTIDYKTLNDPNFLSEIEEREGPVVVKVRKTNSTWNSFATTGKYNAEYEIVYTKEDGTEVYLGKLPESVKKNSATGTIQEGPQKGQPDPNTMSPNGDPQLIALKEALWEGQEIELTLQRKTYGQLNVKKNVEGKPPVANNPLEVLGDYSKATGSNMKFVTVIRVGEDLFYSDEDGKYKVTNSRNNLTPGKVYMIVPSANGQMVPVLLFTNKIKDTKKMAELEKLVNKVQNSKSPKGVQFESALSKINDLFLKKDISFDGTVWKVMDTSTGGTTNTYATAEEAIAAMGEFIVKIPLNSTSKGLKDFANSGVLTTNAQTDSETGMLFHSAGFIFDAYTGTAKPMERNQEDPTEESMSFEKKEEDKQNNPLKDKDVNDKEELDPNKINVENPTEAPQMFGAYMTNIPTPKKNEAASPEALAHAEKLVELGKTLDANQDEVLTNSSVEFKGIVDNRRIFEIKTPHGNFLMYESTGTGSGIESKGAWVPLLGFSKDGNWFIKTTYDPFVDKVGGTLSDRTNPKFNKYGSEIFQAFANRLAREQDSAVNELTPEQEAENRGETTEQPAQQSKPAEKGTFSVHALRAGLKKLAGEDLEKRDFRQDANKLKGDESVIIETTENGKKIFTRVSQSFDNIGRRGFIGVSLILPESTTKTKEDVKDILDAKFEEIGGERATNIEKVSLDYTEQKAPTSEDPFEGIDSGISDENFGDSNTDRAKAVGRKYTAKEKLNALGLGQGAEFTIAPTNNPKDEYGKQHLGYTWSSRDYGMSDLYAQEKQDPTWWKNKAFHLGGLFETGKQKSQEWLNDSRKHAAVLIAQKLKERLGRDIKGSDMQILKDFFDGKYNEEIGLEKEPEGTYKSQDRWSPKEELAWIKDRLGAHILENTKLLKHMGADTSLESKLNAIEREFKNKVSDETYQMLIELAKQGKTMQGLFTDAGIYLTEYAHKGVAYHEAFHVVWNLSLTSAQRGDLIKAARNQFKNELKEDATDIDVEELLADKFQDYVQQNGRGEIARTKVGRFFQRLFRILKTFTNKRSPLTIEGLFKDINIGVYKNKPKFKNTDLSKFTRFSTRESVRGNNDALFDHPTIKQDALDTLRQTYFAIIDDIRKQHPEFKNSSDSDIINKWGVSKLNNILLTEVAGRINKSTGQTRERLISLFNELAGGPAMQKAGETVWPNAKKEGNQIKFSGTTPLLRQFNTYLAKDGIMITLFNAKGTIDTYQTDQTKVQEEDNTLEEAWYRGIAKINPKDTMTQRLKRFFDTIPVYTAGTANDRANAQIVTNYFGAAQTESGSKIFSYLIERISGSRNVDEMMKKLEDLQRAKPFIRQIVNELKNNESLKSDLFIHIGSKSYMTYLISIYDKFTGNFIITPSNRKNLNEIINQDLVSNFENQGNLLFNKHKGGQKRGRDFENINAQAVHTFEADLKEAQNVLKKNPGSVLQGKDLKDLSESLNKYGFFLSEVELGQLQASENLKEARTSMENFLASMLSLTNMLKNNKNPFLYDKAPSTIKTKGIQGDKGIVGKIAASISKIYDTQVQSSFRNVNDETIYNLQPSSFLTEKISQFKNKEELLAFIEETKSDPLFLTSPLLADLKEENGNYRNNLQIAQLDGLRIKNGKGTPYTELSDIEMEKLAMSLWKNSGGLDSGYGWYKFPIPSDAGSLPLIKMQKLSINQIVEKLTEVARGEFNTIKKLQNLKENNPNAAILRVKLFKEKGLQFNTLSFLNKKGYENAATFEDIQDDIADEIADYLDTMLQEEIQQYKDKGIITGTDSRGNLQFAENVLDNNTIKNNQSDEFFKSYIYNAYYANTQMTTLFSGNPAFYKSSVDYQKRNKQAQSQSTKVDVSRMKNASYNVVYLKDVEMQSTKQVRDNVSALIDSSSLSPQEKKRLKAAWQGAHNITDAQTIISPRRYEDIMRGLNRFTPEIEAALNRIRQGKETEADIALLPPIKPFVFTQKNIDGFMVPVQHKNSEILLSRQMAKATKVNPDTKESELLSPQLSDMYDMMNPTDPEVNPVDSFMFESAVKVGQVDVVDFDKIEGNPPIQTFSNEDWGLQQETPPHYVDETGKFGTQIRNIVIEDIDLAGHYTIPGEKSQQGKKVVKEFQDLVRADLEDSYNRVARKFQNEDGTLNYPGLIKMLKEQVIEQNLGQSYLDAISETFDEVTGEVKPRLPFVHPKHSYRIESLLNSMFKKGVTQQKIAGGAAINVSSFGVADNLEFKVDKKKGVVEMEVMMPWWSKSKFPTNEKGEPDLEALDQEGLLDLISYRIPTEFKYSMFKMKVVGFTPKATGGMLIMPREVTTLAGLDFDVDKLYLMVPTFKKNADGTISKVQYSTDSDALYKDYLERVAKSKEAKEVLKEEGLVATDPNFKTQIRQKEVEVLNLLTKLGFPLNDDIDANIQLVIEILEEEGKIFTEKEFKEQSIELQNSKQARDNRKIDIMNGILSNKKTAEDILNFGNFDALKAEAAKMRLYKQGKSSEEINSMSQEQLVKENERLDKEEDRNINLPSTQLEYFRRNMTGRDLTGIMANQKTHNSKAQLTDMQLSYTIKINGEYKSLNSIKHSEDKPKISKNLATFVAAVVDNAKEPISSFINLNTYTADTISLFTRVGMDFETTFAFMNQPILTNLVKDFYNKKGINGVSDSILSNKLITEAIRKLKANISEEINVHAIANSPITLKELQIGLAKAGKKTKPDETQIRLQLKVLLHFEKHKKAGEELGRAVRAGKPDTQGVGPTQAANYVFKENQDRVRNQKQPLIQGAAEVFDETPGSLQTMIPAFNEFGVIKPMDILNKIFPYNGATDSNGNFIWNVLGAIKNNFSNQKGAASLTEKEANKIQSAYMTYIASEFEFFDYGQSKAVMEKIPNMVREFRKNNPDSRYSRFIDSLYMVPANKTIPMDRIEYYNTGKNSVEQEIVMNAWDDMLTHGTKEEQILARNLVRYAFFQSGFEFGANSFMHLVPVNFWATLKDSNGTLFNQHLEAKMNEIRNADVDGNPNLNSSTLANMGANSIFQNQFIRNNPKSNIVKTVDPKNDNNIKVSPNDGTLTVTTSNEKISPYYVNQQPGEFVDYVKVYNKGQVTLYQRIPNAIETNRQQKGFVQTYKEVQLLGTDSFIQEYSYGQPVNSHMAGRTLQASPPAIISTSKPGVKNEASTTYKEQAKTTEEERIPLNFKDIKTAKEVGVSTKNFYHGTPTKIDKLDPLYRQSLKGPIIDRSGNMRRSGSSIKGTGIYLSNQLGFDPLNPTYTKSGYEQIETGPIITQQGENALKWTDHEGVIYETKLKPNAKIVTDYYKGTGHDLDMRNISKEQYDSLREKGIDAIIDVGELVLLNENAIEQFKPIWEAEKYGEYGKLVKVSEEAPTQQTSQQLDMFKDLDNPDSKTKCKGK